MEKRVYEAARCILPVATHAHLYHTVSGLTLLRYHRLCGQYAGNVDPDLGFCDGLTYAQTADLYSMPQHAADVILAEQH